MKTLLIGIMIMIAFTANAQFNHYVTYLTNRDVKMFYGGYIIPQNEIPNLIRILEKAKKIDEYVNSMNVKDYSIIIDSIKLIRKTIYVRLISDLNSVVFVDVSNNHWTGMSLHITDLLSELGVERNLYYQTLEANKKASIVVDEEVKRMLAK